MKRALFLYSVLGAVVAAPASASTSPVRKTIDPSHFTSGAQLAPELVNDLQKALRGIGVAENTIAGAVPDVDLTYIACKEDLRAHAAPTCELTVDGPNIYPPPSGAYWERATVTETATPGSPLAFIYKTLVDNGGIKSSPPNGTRVTFPASIDCIEGHCGITYDTGTSSLTYSTNESEGVAVDVVMDSFVAMGLPNLAPASSNDQTFEVDDVACISKVGGAHSVIEYCFNHTGSGPNGGAELIYVRNGNTLLPAVSETLLDALTEITTGSAQSVFQSSSDTFALRCTRSFEYAGGARCVVTETHKP